jgi:hypothetical protein
MKRGKRSCLLCRACDVRPGRRWCRTLGREVGPHEGRECRYHSADTERVAWPETLDVVTDDIIGGVRIA